MRRILKKVSDDTKLMVKVCDLYYNNDMKQEEIASKLSISRATISRILKNAKSEGIVKIEVINPLKNDYYKLEKQLEEKFDLKEVIIAEDVTDASYERDALGKACAEFLQRVLKDGEIVGLSMGKTIKTIAQYVHQDKPRDISFVPLLGGMGQVGIELHCNQIVIDFFRAFGGEYHLLHAPAMTADPNLMHSLKNDIHIKQVFDLLDKITTAVVGIGTAVPGSTMMETGYYKKEDIVEMKNSGIVGDICLQMYDIEGNTDYSYNNDIFGINLESLKKVRRVVGISAGEEKVKAIKGALNGKIVNVLVTNSSTAKLLLKD